MTVLYSRVALVCFFRERVLFSVLLMFLSYLSPDQELWVQLADVCEAALVRQTVVLVISKV